MRVGVADQSKNINVSFFVVEQLKLWLSEMFWNLHNDNLHWVLHLSTGIDDLVSWSHDFQKGKSASWILSEISYPSKF